MDRLLGGPGAGRAASTPSTARPQEQASTPPLTPLLLRNDLSSLATVGVAALALANRNTLRRRTPSFSLMLSTRRTLVISESTTSPEILGQPLPDPLPLSRHCKTNKDPAPHLPPPAAASPRQPPPAPASPRQPPPAAYRNDPEPDYPHTTLVFRRGGRVVGLGRATKTQCWRGLAAFKVCNCFTHFITHLVTHLRPQSVDHHALAFWVGK